jgi:hypothetical protein
MAMDADTFRECLLLYGADLAQWPEEERQAGLEALDRSLAYRALQEDQVQFEALLRSKEPQAPRADLEARIIAAARRRERAGYPGFAEFLSSCFADLRLPAPALTAAAVLIVGIMIGLWLPAAPVQTESESVEAQVFLDSATEAL